MPHRRIAAMFALLACLAPAFAAHAAEATYAIDPVHTRVMFAVSHAGFSNALGTFSGTTGTLVFDPDDFTTARVDVQVPLQRLDLGDAKWNAAVLAKNFLDAQAHPAAHFVSTRIEPIDATHATVIGQLTLRGVTREVRLDATFHQLKRHPLPPFHRTAGFSATTKFSRKLFAMTAWPSVVGDEVELRIEAEAVRSRGNADNNADDAMPANDATTMSAPSVEPAPTTTTTP
jgi:polyisoprenoid-binding protein YceI